MRLAPVLREVEGDERGMVRWRYAKGRRVKETKRLIRESQNRAMYERLLPSSDTTGSMFLPVAAGCAEGLTESVDTISGISIAFPDGTQVNIKHGSAQAIMSFLKLYQMEDLPCLD